MIFLKDKEIKETASKEANNDYSYFEKQFQLYCITIKRAQVNSETSEKGKDNMATDSDKGLDNWKDALVTKNVPF